MRGYILCLVGIAAITAAATVSSAEEKADGKRSLGGSGHMIQLTLPPGDGRLSGIEVHGSRYGTPTPPEEQFLIYILNEDRTKIESTKMAAYALFERGEEKWVRIEFDQAVTFPENGWIVLDFRPDRTKGVYVSYDAEAPVRRSLVGLPGLEAAEPGFEGNWMIRPLSAR